MTISEGVSANTTEFHRFYGKWLDKVESNTFQYPLIAAISMVVLGLLGLLNVLTFSLSAILSGAVLLTLSASIGRTIYRDPGGYWAFLKDSLYEVKDALFTLCQKKEAPQQPTANS